jgi:hypothetical protein
MKKFKLCLLHIGTAKTATTSMQASFSLNRRKLADMGLYYPVTPGIENHTKLAVYAVDDGRMTGAKKRTIDGFAGDIGAFRRNLRDQMHAEFRRVRQETLLLSNEHLHQHLNSVDEKRRLKELLDQWCDDYRILVYLRRQDKLAVSLFSTQLKAGATDFKNVLPNVGKALPYAFDYKRILEQYGEVFGIDRITPAIFEKESFFRGDTIEDVYQRIGVSSTDGFETVEPANESLSYKAQAFLAELNALLAPGIGGDNSFLRSNIAELLSRKFSGRGKTLSRPQATAFYQRFAESNEWVRHQFFPQQRTLFREDFSEYPETIVNDTSPADMVEIAAYLLQEQQKLLNRSSRYIPGFAKRPQASTTRSIKSLKNLATRAPITTLRILWEQWKSPANAPRTGPGERS